MRGRRLCKRWQSGQSLLSALLSLVIVLIAMTIAVECLVAGAKVVRANRQRLVASAIGESELEMIRAQPGGDVPEVVGLSLSPPNLDQLPNARCTLTVTPYRLAPLKQVQVVVTWHAPDGPVHSRTLTTLIGMR